MARTATSDASASPIRPGSILVIDDEEIMREILEALLTREGYNVRLAANASESSSGSNPLPSLGRNVADSLAKSTTSKMTDLAGIDSPSVK